MLEPVARPSVARRLIEFVFEYLTMRWSGQEISNEAGDPAALPGLDQLHNLVRSVRTPEFAGITFHEVLAKSALNRVPKAAGLPFNWTVNPYRGCSHGCVYCFARTHPHLPRSRCRRGLRPPDHCQDQHRGRRWPASCAERRGPTNRWRSGRTPIPTSAPKVATGSCQESSPPWPDRELRSRS